MDRLAQVLMIAASLMVLACGSVYLDKNVPEVHKTMTFNSPG